MKNNIRITLEDVYKRQYYGCPAEENAGGKAYLVRDGYFDDCDIAITWRCV